MDNIDFTNHKMLQGELLLVEDCHWNQWQPWSACTKSCVQDTDMRMGIATRNRTSQEPKNGGLVCDDSLAFDIRNCPRIDDSELMSSFVFCPGKASWESLKLPSFPSKMCPLFSFAKVDAIWESYSDWSDWRSCSSNCGGGERWRSRRRSCTKGRHGGVVNCEGPSEDIEKEACNTQSCLLYTSPSPRD